MRERYPSSPPLRSRTPEADRPRASSFYRTGKAPLFRSHRRRPFLGTERRIATAHAIGSRVLAARRSRTPVPSEPTTGPIADQSSVSSTLRKPRRSGSQPASALIRRNTVQENAALPGSKSSIELGLQPHGLPKASSTTDATM